eukprot:gene8538-17609_t
MIPRPIPLIRLARRLNSTTAHENYWLPFTNNRAFLRKPKIFTRANGVFYYLEDGTEILDGAAGLWCVNVGHGNPVIAEAIKNQLDTLDYAPSFNVSHKLPFDLARDIISLLPNRNFDKVFFTMCGSTAVDTSLKIVSAYNRSRGKSSKVRFIGRERGYHGVGLGGISVGGIPGNTKPFAGCTIPNVSHIPHTHSLKDMAFSHGEPTWGLHLAEELERLVSLYDASTIAAVIIEPVAGSTGVLPPPQGYLKRIREICTKHDILLIFDEVITSFGRLGESFATVKFDVTPDIIVCAKGLTNGVVPAGAVICQKGIYDSIIDGAERDGPGSSIELFHGYTYTGHPLAMAAGRATLKVMRDDNILQRATELAPYWENALHSLKGLPHVIDIRNCGLMGGVEVSQIPGLPTKRSGDIFDRCFEKGVFVRQAGSTIAGSPALIYEKKHIDRYVNTLAEAIVESSKYLSV